MSNTCTICCFIVFFIKFVFNYFSAAIIYNFISKSSHTKAGKRTASKGTAFAKFNEHVL